LAILKGKTIFDRVTGQRQISLPCRITNLRMEPGRPLRTSLHLTIRNKE